LPYGPLVEDDLGNFYGTTLQGGLYNQGTAFKLTPAGTELTLYSFGGEGVVTGSVDGMSPQCNLALPTAVCMP
jgi:uncharacterized repeat protein (TIGR03803 family)